MIPFLVDYVIVKIILAPVDELKATLEAANQAIKDNNSPVTVEGFQPATPQLGKLNGLKSRVRFQVYFVHNDPSSISQHDL